MGIRLRRAHLHSRTHIVSFGIVGAFGFISLLVAAISISVGTLVSNWLTDLPDYQSADAYLVAEPTQVIASDGTVIAEYYLQNRRSVEMDDIANDLITATVDVEDERFYKHNGVDPQGIVRAAIAQLTGNSQGASTITQQLVRNTVLSEEQFDQTLRRKVREAYIAIQMEKTYTKDQILLMYLNTIYYGEGAYGIEAASITYFNKDASELTLNEAATLAGIPQAPSYYDPFVDMEKCKERRDHVLDRMLALGDITQEQYDQTVAEDIELSSGSFSQEGSESPYFTDYVRQLLLEDFDQDVILRGGLKVYTTLDLDWQEAAEDAVLSTLNDIDGGTDLQAAMVAIDPDTGYIKAMVGGRDYDTNQFNMSTQSRRQPGSSFKLFTFVAALQEGVNPDIYIDCNSPKQITSTWKVQNYDNVSYGTLTLTQALAVSSNTGFAQVAVSIGADKIADVAHTMGIDVDLPAYPSITLGTEGVPPVQMAEGYATIATGGIHHDSIAITRIEDRNGNVVYEHEDNSERAVKLAIANVTTEALENVITSSNGTAHVLNSTLTYDQPVAGKTGTSEDFRDLWFCGFTPQVSVAIWVGYEDDTPIRINGSYLHPYNSACPIFAAFTNVILDGVEREEFPTTDAVPTYKQNSEWDFSVSYSSKQSYSATENSSYSSDSSSDSSDDDTTEESEESSRTSSTTDETTDTTDYSDTTTDTTETETDTETETETTTEDTVTETDTTTDTTTDDSSTDTVDSGDSDTTSADSGDDTLDGT